MPSVSYTLDQAANQIALIGWKDAWQTPVTYAFRDSSSSSGFSRFTSTQIAAAQEALKLWSDVAMIKFERVGTGYSNAASILFSGQSSEGGYAWGYFPDNRASLSSSGDVFINPSNGWFSAPVKGSYEFMVFVHEIGHAIGLNHPGNYDGEGATYTRNALYVQDSLQYSVMSYFDASQTGASHGGVYAATPLLHDIAAVQKLYGANWSTRTGNTTYGFNSNADRAEFKITSVSEKVVFAIWDAGGNDTLNFSGYSQNARIDLNEAAFSNVGGLTKNVAIARGAIIENAIGGAGHDMIVGTAKNNSINGGAGNDMLFGRGGWDVMVGGAGADTFVFDRAFTSGVSRIADFYAPTETVRLENAVFKGLGAATGSMNAALFFSGARAHDANDRIIYNKVSGELFYDADGTGAALQVKFAMMSAAMKPTLSAADFFVI